MSHIRQQIRKQVVAELSALAPATVESVSSTRLYPYREVQLPAINVYVETEESEAVTLGGKPAGSVIKRMMDRVLTLPVEIYATATTDVDDALDGLAVEVEKILGNTLLNGLAKEINLATTTLAVDSEAEVPIGVLTMTWNILYNSLEGDPELPV